MPRWSKLNGKRCGLLANVPDSINERRDYWYKVKQLSLTHQLASQMVEEANYGREMLQMVKHMFESSFSDLWTGKMSDGIFLDRFFVVFSEVFFFRRMGSDCQLRFVPKDSPSWTKNQNRPLGPVKGYSKDHRYDGKEVMTRITIYEREDGDQRARAIAHLGTLAHEMIHSFFHVYTCLCKEKCAAIVAETQGLTVHGLAWQRCAMTIENVLKRTLGEDITLSRAKPMGKELVYREASASTMPLKILGLESDDVEDAMDFYYKLKSREQTAQMAR